MYLSIFPLHRANRVCRVLALTDPVLTDPSLISALESYDSHLTAVEKDLSDRQAIAEKALKEYENSKGMADIAKRYVQALKETEEVQREMERLDSGKA
jgi:gamma-glutamylcysteine synthetase